MNKPFLATDFGDVRVLSFLYPASFCPAGLQGRINMLLVRNYESIGMALADVMGDCFWSMYLSKKLFEMI